ncbi:MAG: ribosomal protein S18-alanine N-acetyltransferase [Rhodoglobus sp.]
MTWQLRRATLDDLDAVMAIETTTFADDAWSPEIMRAELADRNGYYLVAFPPERPDQIEAYAGLRSPRRQPQADIQTIAVVASARRQGLGRVLMQRMIAEARDRGATELFLEVRADNPTAEALYISLGFEQLAQRPNYYGAGLDALVMRLTIHEPEVTVA